MANWGLKNLHSGPLFSIIFDNSRKNNGQAPFVTFCFEALQWLWSRPCARPAHVAESGPRARLHVLQNSGSQVLMWSVKILSARDRHWQNPRKKLWRAQQYKSARIGALTGSVIRRMAKGLQKVSSSWGNRTQVAILIVDRLNHWAIGLHQQIEKNRIFLVHDSMYLLHAGLSFSDCSGWISRPYTIYQNSWMLTFDW